MALTISLAAAQTVVTCNSAGTLGDLPPVIKVPGGYLLDGVTFYTLRAACDQACSDQYV
jgi:hypothetical protein